MKEPVLLQQAGQDLLDILDLANLIQGKHSESPGDPDTQQEADGEGLFKECEEPEEPGEPKEPRERVIGEIKLMH